MTSAGMGSGQSRIFEVMPIEDRYRLLTRDMQRELMTFMSYLTALRRLAPETVKRISKVSIRFMHWTLAERGRSTLKDATVDDMIDYMMDCSHLQKSTWVVQKQNLAALLDWMVIQGWKNKWEAEKFTLIRVKVPSYRTSRADDPLTDKELAYLFDTIERKYPYNPKPVDRLNRGMKVAARGGLIHSMQRVQITTIITLLLETGFRLGEVSGLTMADIDPVNRSIPTIGKGERYRTVPYTDLLRRQMRVWIAHRELISKDHDSVWICIQRNMGDPLSKLGLEHIFRFVDGDYRFQRFRRTFAVRSHEAGMDLLTIQQMLGHSNVKTTSIYLGIPEEKVLADSATFEGERAKRYSDMMPTTHVGSGDTNEEDE